MNKLTLEILDAFMLIVESRTIANEKNEAVKKQDFEKAIEWRTKENEINDRLPKWADLERMRSELNESINQVNIAERLCLIHAEVSEALEADRKGKEEYCNHVADFLLKGKVAD